MMLKIAALPPIPSASVAMAISANPGRRASARTAARISCIVLVERMSEAYSRGRRLNV